MAGVAAHQDTMMASCMSSGEGGGGYVKTHDPYYHISTHARPLQRCQRQQRSATVRRGPAAAAVRGPVPPRPGHYGPPPMQPHYGQLYGQQEPPPPYNGGPPPLHANGVPHRPPPQSGQQWYWRAAQIADPAFTPT